MSFSFGFTSENFSDDELQDDSITGIGEVVTASPIPFVNPLDEERLLASDVFQPQLLGFEDVVKSLKDVRLTFETVPVLEGHVQVYRRELFDVKHQLMSESDVNGNVATKNDDMLEILLGDTAEDVRKNVYEGGLKSWECSLDLIELITKFENEYSTSQIFDMGCGTALPSSFVFGKYLESGSTDGLNMILSDYNSSVLQLVTVPNLIITWAKKVLSEAEWEQLQRATDENIQVTDDELQLSTALLEAFVTDISRRNIKINLISGSWGRKFSNLIETLIQPGFPLLALSSETIYQPENLPVVAETILALYESQNGRNTKVLVAAKDIYFGVGGSIIEFENYLQKRIQELKSRISYNTFKVNSNLKRSIISVKTD
ncbi:hypothetical protein RNJ44_02214 [Nakaseomyces bracarensis]|uniref:Histidine protein methyltransferase 1 n=1 Tax=Nakaseomyces bracarensis TaxID=273131 RepID=A0ABR4NMS8_9SACH